MKHGAQHIQCYIFNHSVGLVQCDPKLSMELSGVRVAWDLNTDDDAPADLINLFITIQWFLWSFKIGVLFFLKDISE